MDEHRVFSYKLNFIFFILVSLYVSLLIKEEISILMENKQRILYTQCLLKF